MTPVHIGPATLYLGDAYTIRPTLGFMDADVMDPPYLFDNSGGGAFRAARGASDQIVADIRDVYAEAKAVGYDAKIMRQIVRLRKMQPDDRREMELLLDTYKCALGIG